MSNVIQGTTYSGKRNYSVTIGNTTYYRTEWNEIIEILNIRAKDVPVVNTELNAGKYKGD